MIKSVNTHCHSISYNRGYLDTVTVYDPINNIMTYKYKLAKPLIPETFLKGSQNIRHSLNCSYINKTFVPNLEFFHFLLVDDNIINLMILNRVLKKMYPNATIDTTQNSRLVVEMVKMNSYDIIFLDIEMPVMSGTEIATIIRSEDELNHIPLVAVTSKCHTKDLQYYEEIGIDFTFSKPLYMNYHYLSNNINDVMKSRRQI